jgi:hypothetical protein
MTIRVNEDQINRRTIARFLGQTQRRDYAEVFGHPLEITPIEYRRMYERGGIAARIIDAFPNATWREKPEIDAPGFDVLADQTSLFSVLARADRLTNIGHYGVVLLGFNDGKSLAEPLEKGSASKLLYAQPHGEYTAQIQTWNNDTKSPRFGKPNQYLIQSGINWTGTGSGQMSLTVHHSRVIHIAENALENESIGLPRLERIWDRVLDLNKLLGSSAEIYWQNVAQMIAFVASADAEWEPEEQEAMKKELQEMQDGLRRFLRLRGVEPHQLAAGLQGATPKDHVDVQLDMISGAWGIPKRILIGSERGELSSKQDENNWAARIAERREQYATPNVLVPTIDRLQYAGVIAENQAYSILWPEIDVLGETEKATIGLQKSQALATYNNAPGADLIVPAEEFREKILGLEPELPALPDEPPLDETDLENVVTPFNNRKRK